MAAKKITPKPTGPASDDDFEYTFDGETFTVPSLATVDAGFMRRTRKLSGADQTFTLLEERSDARTLAIIDRMDGREFAAFQRAWTAHSGVDLGE